MNCRIDLDNNGNITGMRASNEAPSLLFQAALEKTQDVNKAVDITLVAETENFVKSVLNPTIRKHQNNIYKQLNSLAPKNDGVVQLIHKKKQHEIYIDSLDYEVIPTKAFTTYVASTEIDGEKVVLGKLRMKAFQDGMMADQVLVSPLRVYENGKVTDGKGLGIGTEMFKEAIVSTLGDNQKFYISSDRTEGSKGLVKKITDLGIVNIENGIEVISPLPQDFKQIVNERLSEKEKNGLIRGGSRNVEATRIAETSSRTSSKNQRANAQNQPLDVNGEPKLNIVMQYIQEQTAQTQPLNLEQKQELRNSMVLYTMETSSEFGALMEKAFYDNGEFVVNETKLRDSGIYSTYEIENIKNDISLQATIKDSLEALKNTEEVFNNTYIKPQYVESGIINSFGKKSIQNPFEVERQVQEALAGVKDQAELEERLQSLPFSTIQDMYDSSEQFQQELLNEMSGLSQVGVVEENGEAVSKSNTRVKLEKATKVVEDLSVAKDIEFILSFADVFVQAEQEMFEELTAQIEKKVVESGIDIIGLSGKIRQDNFKNILEALHRMILNPTTANVNDFAEMYDANFDVDSSQLRKAVKVRDKNKKYVLLDTKISEYKLFTEQGLLKVKDKLYHKVKRENLEALYDKIYQISLYNEYTLPVEAFPSVVEKGTINLSKLRNPENKSKIVTDIKQFIQNKTGEMDVMEKNTNGAELEQMLLMKYYFNNPINEEFQRPANNFTQFTGDLEYLTDEFIADFNIRSLKEKIKNSTLYQNFYSKFDINEKGIYLRNEDPITLEQIKDYIEAEEDLKQYSLLSNQMPDLISEEGLPTKEYNRDRAVNYPYEIPRVEGNYEQVDNETLKIENPKQEFVRLADEVFELIKDGIYKKLPKNSSDYNMFNIKAPEANVEKIVFESAESEEFVKAKNKITTKESNQLDSEIFECKNQ